MGEMDADGSGEVDFEEFSEWWTKQQAAGGKWQLDQISAMAKTKRWADRLGDGLLSMLAHHYRFVLPAGSGAKVSPNPPAAVLCQPLNAVRDPVPGMLAVSLRTQRRVFKQSDIWSRRPRDRSIRTHALAED